MRLHYCTVFNWKSAQIQWLYSEFHHIITFIKADPKKVIFYFHWIVVHEVPAMFMSIIHGYFHEILLYRLKSKSAKKRELY